MIGAGLGLGRGCWGWVGAVGAWQGRSGLVGAVGGQNRQVGVALCVCLFACAIVPALCCVVIPNAWGFELEPESLARAHIYKLSRPGDEGFPVCVVHAPICLQVSQLGQEYLSEVSICFGGLCSDFFFKPPSYRKAGFFLRQKRECYWEVYWDLEFIDGWSWPERLHGPLQVIFAGQLLCSLA